MRIQETKTMRIHADADADADPQHWLLSPSAYIQKCPLVRSYKIKFHFLLGQQRGKGHMSDTDTAAAKKLLRFSNHGKSMEIFLSLWK
jgi:hypothetical protein